MSDTPDEAAKDQPTSEPAAAASPPPPAAAPPPPPAAPPAPSAAAAAPPPPPAPAVAPPPPPPPPGPTFDAGAQARALFSQLDPTGLRPTAIVAGIIVALFFGAQLLNAITPVTAVGPGQPGPGGPGPVGPGPVPTTDTGGPGSTPLPPGSTLTVGPLRIPLEGGWSPQQVPNSNVIVRLTKGNVAVDLFSASVQGQADSATVYREYISFLQGQSQEFTATQPNVTQMGNGILAARGSYTGVFGQSQVEGQVTAFLSDATQGFIFDIWADAGALTTLLPEAQRMVDNTQVQ